MNFSSKKEDQHTEFKIIWKDEFLKLICAFSNAKGGELFIGVDDNGNVVGLNNSKKLLDDIPNKTIQFLGIVVDVHLQTLNDLHYLSVIVNQSPTPISYKGVYYIRSGSTVQELKGSELQYFILKKLGKSFDELLLSSAAIDDIDFLLVKKFIKTAIKNNRLPLMQKMMNCHLCY